MLFFSNIDLTSSFFQIALVEDSQNLTAFITQMGLYNKKNYRWDSPQHQDNLKV